MARIRNPHWNIWRIKSPWLRVPVALLIAALTFIVLYPALLIASAIIGAGEGIVNGVRDFWDVVEFKSYRPLLRAWRS